MGRDVAAAAAAAAAGLNDAQREAVLHGAPGTATPAAPLLVIAGAGSGKTATLAHRVAHLIDGGVDPRRILLLTFTRRAALEMTRRAQQLVAAARAERERAELDWDAPARARDGRLAWSGTFHAVGNRLLRLYADVAGLDPAFTVLDRSDAADLLDWLRTELGLATRDRRFPRKGTCLAIYSHVVNARCELALALERAFPWCAGWEDELRALFAAYVEAKQARSVLDYDDLLLYWRALMDDPAIAHDIGGRFDHVLVDEFQDTNRLQLEILLAMKPDGAGLTAVGDDAQAIYSFRAADVRNILDFPHAFARPARVVTLEQSYRSTQPILDACNAVIGLARERFTKNLRSTRASARKPRLVAVEDELAQVDYVVGRVLALREEGVALRRQAVLFRSGHHSDALEVELGRRRIPYVKYGGLKFLEAAHVKDVLCVLRWVENRRDIVAAHRVLKLLPGVGPASARRLFAQLEAGGFRIERLRAQRIPGAAADEFVALCDLLEELGAPGAPWEGQVERVSAWYATALERLHDAAPARAADIDQLERIATTYPTRERFLSELALDPPDATSDEAGEPRLDDDFLVLSTIHSAKGQEWDAVTVLDVVDGCIPSDMATKDEAQIEEERRLLYVAMTRARDDLALVVPQRFYVHHQPRRGDRHVYAARSRFLPDALLGRFERVVHRPAAIEADAAGRRRALARIDVAARMRSMWSG
ncbi:MAG: ATP-dependent helicase [Myxococcales bacterium]|nr:ATP-dependent helicase [Myxococcales bacterium]